MSPGTDTNLQGQSLPEREPTNRLQPEGDMCIPYERNIPFRAVRNGNVSPEAGALVPEPSGTSDILPFRRDFSLGGAAAAFIGGINRWRQTQLNEQLAHAMIEAVSDILHDHARLLGLSEVAHTIIGAEPHQGRLLMRNEHGAEWVLDYRSKGFECPRTFPRDLLARLVPTWGESELSIAFQDSVQKLRDIAAYSIVPRVIPDGTTLPSGPPRPTRSLVPGTHLGDGLTLTLVIPATESSLILNPTAKGYLGIPYEALSGIAQGFLHSATAHIYPHALPTRSTPLWSAVSTNGTASATFVRLLLDPRLDRNSDYLLAHPDRDTVVVAHRGGSDLPALAAKVKEVHANALRPVSPNLFRVVDERILPENS
jgi:hypothetical protein